MFKLKPAMTAFLISLTASIPLSSACGYTPSHLTPMRRPISTLAGPATVPVPARWRKDVQHVLITDTRIATRLKALAREIARDFSGRELVVVSLLNGTV